MLSCHLFFISFITDPNLPLVTTFFHSTLGCLHGYPAFPSCSEPLWINWEVTLTVSLRPTAKVPPPWIIHGKLLILSLSAQGSLRWESLLTSFTVQTLSSSPNKNLTFLPSNPTSSAIQPNPCSPDRFSEDFGS